MEYAQLGTSGLSVPALNFGIGNFGGSNVFLNAWSTKDAEGANK